jgi:electron transport complex protein RnfG
MSSTSHPIIRSSVLLGLIALLGTALLVGVNELTYERILEQEKRRVLQQLNAIVPTALYNNDLLEDVIEIKDEVSFRHPAAVTVYRARMDDQPVAVMMLVTAPDGYNGDIRLLAGIDAGGTVLGVRVVSHRETPGLGDPIEAEKSDWILGFANKSLRNPETGGWAVKRDGGQFDQFTGATISPRAVVRTIHNTLLYFAANRQMLFETPSKSESMKMASQNGE